MALPFFSFSQWAAGTHRTDRKKIVLAQEKILPNPPIVRGFCSKIRARTGARSSVRLCVGLITVVRYLLPHRPSAYF
jgi:hypothetical protein